MKNFAEINRTPMDIGVKTNLKLFKLFLVVIGLLITSLTIPTWGSISFTVGVTGTGSSSGYGGSDYNKMKLNAQFRWDNTEKGWITNTMSKAGMTFEGLDLYITSMTYDDAIQTNHMQFQKYKDNYQVYSWDAYSGKKEGSYWDTYIVAYGGSPYSRVSVSSGAKFYFDASGWSQTAIKLVAGHANHQQYYTMTNVSGTKLYYLSTSSYSNAMGIGVVGNSSRSGSNNQWLTDVSSHASEYTGWKHYGLTSTGANNAYLMVNNGATGEEPSMHYNDSYSTLLNSTQTYNTVVKTIGGSYTSANSKSTINISSYELTSQGGTTNRTPELSTTENQETVSACRTATTRLQVGTPATGYQFDGWYTAATSGSKISDNTDYTYYPTGANTYYARFSEIARTVTVAYKCSESSIHANGSVANVGVSTSKSVTALDIEGYTFSTWSAMPSGVTTSSSLTSATISINATAGSKTITANYTLNSHTLTWNLDGGTVVTAGTCASIGATGTPSGSVNYGASITAPVPEKDGYTFAGWNTTPASTMPDNDLTYTAQWTEITHTVSFANDGNGSTSPSSDQTVGEVTGIAISATPNTGYEFNTWTSSNGGTFTSAATTASNTFKPTAGDATLTASFRAKTYSITLSASSDQVGGGESVTDGSASVTYMGTSLTSIVAPTRPGYEVEYYTLNANGNNTVADNEGALEHGLLGYLTNDGEWIYDDNLTIYAHWVPKTYTITLDANRDGIPGTAGSTSFSVTIGSNNFDFDLSTAGRQSMTAPTKEGYTFDGYYDDPDYGEGTKVINADASKPTTTYVNSDGNWISSDDNLTLYAHWEDNGTYVFKGGTSGNETNWSTATNWTKGKAPSAATDSIVLLAPIVIPASATTSVKSVRIGTAGSYTLADGETTIAAAGKLTIPATAMLKVTNDVKNYSYSTSTASATTPATLHIQSASTGNGALVWGKASSTPGEAQVDFYTKSSAGGTGTGTTSDVNQYIGTPFSDESNYYNYYNAWVFEVDYSSLTWKRLPMGTGMNPFVGYDVIYDGDAGHVFEMDGTLVTNGNKSVSAPNATESVLANSWVAPIKIKAFEASDFTGPNATIYIFNSTSEKATSDNSYSNGVTGGNYSTYTPGSAEETDVIPSMQSFSVTGGNGTVSLDYAKLVKTPASHSLISAMHAPRRVVSDNTEPEEEIVPTMERLKIYVSDENGWADLLKICIREDFVEEFENGFDAYKMYGDYRAPMLYGISPDGMMAINCIPTADNHIVGFHAGEASNEYTFRFSYDGEDNLYLRDNKTGIETFISAENTYTFTSESGDSDMRFVIIKKAQEIATGVDELNADAPIQKIMYNGMLYIIRSGRIYNAEGALVK